MNQKSTELEFRQIHKELDILSMLGKLLDLNGLDNIQIRAAASCLHSIYNGIEKILIMQLTDKNIKVETNYRWHIQLLELSLNENLITAQQYEGIKQYMGFRHFFRHNYGFELDSDLIAPLIRNIHSVVDDLEKSLGNS